MDKVHTPGDSECYTPLLKSIYILYVPEGWPIFNLTFIFGGCILLRSLPRLYYGGRQSQQSFLLL
jgi:hypothetical protein